MIALGTPPSQTARQEIELARFSEEMGFEGVSLTERVYDGHVMLTAIGLLTKRISIASSSGIHYRSPTLAAIDAAIIDELSGGRLILGLVPGSPVATAPFGLRFEKEHILAKMREYVEIVRRLLAGERVSIDGEVYKIKGAQIHFKPARKKVPILVGARGPRLSQLAGEVSDGAFVGGLQPPEFVKLTVDNVRLGARKAGRDPSELDLTAAVFYFGTLEDARRFTAWWMNYQPMYDDVWQHSGLLPLVQKIRKSYGEGDTEAALGYVDERTLSRFALWGSKEECKELLEEFWSIGLTRLKIAPKGKMGVNGEGGSFESTKQTIKKVASIVLRDS